jgi:dynein heavy chain
MRKLKGTYKSKVRNYVELVEKPGLPLLNRFKLIALITIEEHNREIIDKLLNKKVTSVNDFDWQSQLRLVKTEEDEQTSIEIYQTNCVFSYGYEYQGNNGRLVVTPLTDRAYMTLTNALHMQRGGAP